MPDMHNFWGYVKCAGDDDDDVYFNEEAGTILTIKETRIPAGYWFTVHDKKNFATVRERYWFQNVHIRNLNPPYSTILPQGVRPMMSAEERVNAILEKEAGQS